MNDILDITGVEKDECLGHVVNNKNLKLGNKNILDMCKNVKFKKNEKHNEGKICLSGCLLHWSDRRRMLQTLLYNISNLCEKLSLEWVLYYGGLLGWYRNKELIPWDADLDILMPHSMLKKFISEGLFNPYIKEDQIVYEDNNIVFILNWYRGDPPNERVIRDPIIGIFIDKNSLLYCDVFYWMESDIPDEILISWIPSQGKPYLLIKKDDFFPIKKDIIKTETSDITIYVPQNPLVNLEERYGDIGVIPYYLNNGIYYLKNGIYYKTEKREYMDIRPSNSVKTCLFILLFIFCIIIVWKIYMTVKLL